MSPCSLFSKSLPVLFCRVHRWWSPHPETLVRDRPPHSDWRSETCWQDVHCVCIVKVYTYHWNNDWKPLCSHHISCSYSMYWASGHKWLSLKTWSWLASQDLSTTNVFFFCSVFVAAEIVLTQLWWDLLDPYVKQTQNQHSLLLLSPLSLSPSFWL